MAIEPQPAPRQLVLPTFNFIGRPPALLARFSDAENSDSHRTPSPELMPVDPPPAHSPSEMSGSPGLLSRMSNVHALAGSSVSSSNLAASTRNSLVSTVPVSTGSLSPQLASATSPGLGPPLMSPIPTPARPAIAATNETPAFSPIASTFNRDIAKASSGNSAASATASSQPPTSSDAGTISSATQPSVGLGAATPSEDPEAELCAFLRKRKQSLTDVHTQLASRAKQWGDQAQHTVTSGGELVVFAQSLQANADETVTQAVRAREQAAHAEELATKLRIDVQKLSALVNSLQEEHTLGRNFVDKVEQYTGRLKSWNAAHDEKEQRLVDALREQRRAEAAMRARHADEIAHQKAARDQEEAARAQRDAARAQQEAARAQEHEQVAHMAAELEAMKKKILVLSKEKAVLERANKTFLDSVAGLRAFTLNAAGENDESRMAVDQPGPLTSSGVQPTSSVFPMASAPTLLTTTAPNNTGAPPRKDIAPSISTAASSAPPTSMLQPDARSSTSRQSTSPAQTTSRPLVNGFVPAQTEAGRAVDTQRPLASTVRASGSRSAQTGPEVPRSSPLAASGETTSVHSSASPLVSPEVFVKREPEPETLSQPMSPQISQAAAVKSITPARTAPPSVARAVSSLAISQAAETSTPPQRPASTTSNQAPPPAKSAAPPALTKPAPPPIARQPEPLREPSPMGPGFDGDAQTTMPPYSREYDMYDRRSYDTHSEAQTEDRAPATRYRGADLGLPPKPMVQLPSSQNNKRPGEPLSAMRERAPPGQSPVERANSGGVNKRKLDRNRVGPSNPQLSDSGNDHTRPSISSVPAKRTYDDDGPRQSWDDRRRRLSPGQSGQPQYSDSPISPSYERNGLYPPPRQAEDAFDQRSMHGGGLPFPPHPQSPPAIDARFNYNASPPNPRNVRPSDTYRPPEHLSRGPDHWSPSPARSDRDAPPIQRRSSRNGDTYRPPLESPIQRRQSQGTGEYEKQSRRAPAPRQASPQDRPRPSPLQGRISDANNVHNSGSAPSENRLTLEERLQTGPALPDTTPQHVDLASRITIGDDRAPARQNSSHAGGSNITRGGAARGAGRDSGAGSARGRGTMTTSGRGRGRGRGKSNGQGGQRRDMSPDDNSGPGLLGRMS